MEGDDNHEKKKDEGVGWLQSTANMFVIIEAVINIVSHLTTMYRHYCDITKEVSPGEAPPYREVDENHQQQPRTPSYPLNPPEDVQTDNESEQCKICITNKCRTINLPCGHMVFCFGCCKHFIENNYEHACPMCRARIKEIKIYYN
jgi:hypothetical protein